MLEGYGEWDRKAYKDCPAHRGDLWHFSFFIYPASSKGSSCSVGDPVSTPGSGRSPGEGHGDPL